MSASAEFPLEVRPVAAVKNKEQVDQIVKGDHDVLLMHGAAPKVEMRLGQVVTNIVPDFASRKWVGFAGKIAANPFLDICRSQIDVQFDCSAETLLREMKGFHWMMSYGNYLQETGYALKKVGVDWLNLDRPQAT